MNAKKLATNIGLVTATLMSPHAHGVEPHDETTLPYTRLGAGTSVHYEAPDGSILGGIHASYRHIRYLFSNPNLRGAEEVLHGGVDLNILKIFDSEVKDGDFHFHAGLDIGMHFIGKTGPSGIPPTHIGIAGEIGTEDWGAKIEYAPGVFDGEVGHTYASAFYHNEYNHLLEQQEESIGMRGRMPLGKYLTLEGSLYGSVGHEVSLQTRTGIELLLGWNIEPDEDK